MAKSRPELADSLRDDDVKAPDLFKRVKEEIDAVLHSQRSDDDHHLKETHGLRNDIDENTSLNDVKAPNVFERAKEEIEALVQTIHTKKESPNHGKRDHSTEIPVSSPENDVKAPNLIDGAKEEIEAITHRKKSPQHHDKETHGMGNDIDENTPVNEIKGPSVFERAKEEIEALVHSIHPKKESDSLVSSPRERPRERAGFSSCLGRGLEKVCSPRGNKRD